MRLKAGVVAAILAAGTTLIYVGPASAQQADGPNCDDCRLRGKPGPPVPYDLTVFPPVAIEPEPEPQPEPEPRQEPQPVPTPEHEAPAAQPVAAEPDFIG